MMPYANPNEASPCLGVANNQHVATFVAPLVIALLSDRGRPLADYMSRKSDAVNGEHLSAAPRSLAKRSKVLRILQGVSWK